MQIKEVIRKYRKERNLTQEEIAARLGVTASAVNKWEKGNSYPDITLLAPIARLLGVTLDTLLSFQEALTHEEINELVMKANEHLKNDSFEVAFGWAKTQIEIYPNCDWLIWQFALILDAWRCSHEVEEAEQYDGYIISCYVRVLESRDEDVRYSAAGSLFNLYLRKEQYEKAEEYLTFFSKQDPERKRKQAMIYSKINRVDEAYKAYEELLFSGHNMLSLVFQSFYMLVVEANDMEKARLLVEKQKQLSVLFEMGEYQVASMELGLALDTKDADKTIDIVERILASVGEMNAFCKSRLYEHMTFKALSDDFLKDVKAGLIQSVQEDENLEFLKEDKRWQQIKEHMEEWTKKRAEPKM